MSRGLTSPAARALAVALLAAVTAPGAARAEETARCGADAAAGAEIDLLPALLSAAGGRLGGGVNVWAGRDHLRLRAVGAHVAFPDGVLTPAGFADRRLTVVAGLVDVFLAPHFTGPWLGGGLEYWWNQAGSPAGPATASWNSAVATLGGGYVWRVWRGVYLNPWAAGHLLLSRPRVALHGATWEPQALTAEVSLKVGVEF